MKILFLTGIYPSDEKSNFNDLVKKGHLQNAANVFQWGIIEGLNNNEVDFEVISFPFLPCFPMRFKTIYTPSLSIMHNNQLIGKIYKYCALPFIKRMSLKYRLRNVVKKWLDSNKVYEGEIVIMTYTALSWMTYALEPLKKAYDFKICSIIPDLVDDATNPVFGLSLVKKIQAMMEQRRVKKSYGIIDCYVLLSEAMQEKIPQAVGNHIVVEGVASVKNVPEIKAKIGNVKTLLYTGSLEYFTGVRNLVEAFCQTNNENFRLIICGDGPLSPYVSEMSKCDTRIIYMGTVTRDISVDLQRKSTLLINPRLPQETLTRYSFPSKTMEYMMSGTPMIGYRLDGIPKEYYNYFYIPEDFSIESLRDKITEVLSLSPSVLYRKAKEAQEFLINNKTSTIQVRRVVDYLSRSVLD